MSSMRLGLTRVGAQEFVDGSGLGSEASAESAASGCKIAVELNRRRGLFVCNQ
jgi:hypothetical protein